MKHLMRAGILVVVFVAAFAAMRLIAPPAFLEAFGFHTVKESVNVAEWASHPALFADTKDCQSCHQEIYAARQDSLHAGVSCENCHGPATAHIETGAPVFKVTSRESCGTCHGQILGRPAGFPQVDLATHGGEAECVTCHNPHDPTAPPPVPHDLAGRSDCNSCHAIEGFVPAAPADHAGRTSDTCLSCHRSE